MSNGEVLCESCRAMSADRRVHHSTPDGRSEERAICENCAVVEAMCESIAQAGLPSPQNLPGVGPLDASAYTALMAAGELALMTGSSRVESVHLLSAILELPSAGADALLLHGVDYDGYTRLREMLRSFLHSGARAGVSESSIGPSALSAIAAAAFRARREGRVLVRVRDLVHGVLVEGASVAARALTDVGARSLPLQPFTASDSTNAPSPGFYDRESGSPATESTPALDRFTRDLTADAREGRLDPLVGREGELRLMIETLARRQKNNPVLIGDPGVGKTAVVEGLAQKIAAGDVPATLSGVRLVSLSLGALVAGTRYRGDFEERLEAIVREATRDPGQIVVFCDEIHTLLGAGGSEGALDAANMLKPALARGELRLIGATTFDEYRRIERDGALERRMSPIYVGEPSGDEAVLVLAGLRSRYEQHHDIEITEEAIAACVDLSVRYLHDRLLPDKALDLLDQAAARLSLARADGARPVLCEQTVQEVVSDRTGIPVGELASVNAQRLASLEQSLANAVVGQPAAIDAVCSTIRRGLAGLSDPRRPRGSFLFVGPTGVGKTELAKALARELFGSEDALVRFDMSEYAERHTISRLIGAPPGYVGHGNPGQLTETVRRRPYSVILLDEIEKAHPDIWNLLLQMLDEGVLTDSMGRKAHYRETVVIMTSNVGSGAVRRSPGFNPDQSDASTRALGALQTTFPPEFLNRVDTIANFESLGEKELESIARMHVEQLAERLRERGTMAKRNLTLTVTDSLIGELARRGASDEYGARNLRRFVDRTLGRDLSEHVHDFPSESGEIEADYDGFHLVLRFAGGEHKRALPVGEARMLASSQANA